MAEKVKIKFLRGTLAQVIGATAEAGKPYFATDTKEVYISDGTSKYLVGKAQVGVIASRPLSSSITVGKIFVATDENNTMYVDNGTAWVKAGITNLGDLAGDLDDITDGTINGKVKLTELNSGKVKQLEAFTSGNPITGDALETHLGDVDKHREIDDITPSSVGLYSSQHIKALIDALTSDVSRLPKVIDYVDATAVPPTEVEGDRYILNGTPHADWDGAGDTDLVEFISGSWVVKVDGQDSANEGTVVYSDGEDGDRALINDGTGSWEFRNTGTTAHNDLTGLNVGAYQHLTADQLLKATVQAGNTNTLGLMSDVDKAKLDGIEAGADDNQDITAQNGVKRSDVNGANGDAVIEADYGIDANVNAVAIVGANSIGDSNKMAHSNHVHVLVEVDGGTL